MLRRAPIHIKSASRGPSRSVIRSQEQPILFLKKMTSPESKKRLSAWFQQWRMPLRKFLIRKGTVRSADLDDVAQEVFLRLLRYERAELIEHPQAYLYKVAANVAAGWAIRARSSHPHEPRWLAELSADEEPSDTVAR